MFITGAVHAKYVYENTASYRRLPQWCRLMLDQYLKVESLSFGDSYVETKRIACSHFLEYLWINGIQAYGEISYHHIIAYHEENSHISLKGRDHYERMVRQFLKYLHHELGLLLSLSFSLNKFYIPYLKVLKNLTTADLERFNLVNRAGKNSLTSMEYFTKSDNLIHIVLPRHKYGCSVIKSFSKLYRLLFIFLEMHHFTYSFSLAEEWFSRSKSIFRTQWKSYRRALFLFEQYLQRGDLIPELKFTSRQDPLQDLPDWCRKPLEAYLLLRKKEGRAKSSLNMIRSSCIRFLRFLLNQHISSFNAVTPDLIAQFNKQDEHKTFDGKNAYNVRIRMFLEYLSEVDMVTQSLYWALPCVSAPKTRIVSILDDAEIEKIQIYRTQNEKPMELRRIAMIMLGLKMGLRSSDIVNLKLSDIYWRNCSLSIIQEKTGTGLTLPMPISVANSIYRYVLHGRPESSSPYVFIHHRVPYIQLSRTACAKALSTVLNNRKGFQITRKTFASKLLKAGNPVNLIVNSLGHQSDDTVSKYLSLDEMNMRFCAISLAAAKIMLVGGVRL